MDLRKAISIGTLVNLLSPYSLATIQLPLDAVKKAKAEHAVEDIEANRLTYSKNCGWVDWGHAKGDGPKSLVDSVLNEAPTMLSDEDQKAIEDYAKKRHISLNQYTPVVYYQYMKKQPLGLDIQAGTRSVYLVKKNLSRKMREGVAWRIFKEVSVQFERMQGQAPYSLIPSTAASSFGIGDLTGDKISFYSALRGYSRKGLEDLCGSYSQERSMKELKGQHYGPKSQGKWRKLPAHLTVPRIPRGIVLTVIKDKNFYGEYK